MILHPDGRVEGTPEEVAAYKQHDILREQADAYRKQLHEDKSYIEALEQSGARMLKANEGSTERKELTEEQVSSLSTYRLVEELEKREGVHVTKISPSGTFTLVYEDGYAGGNIPFSGPAVILVNQD